MLQSQYWQDILSELFNTCQAQHKKEQDDISSLAKTIVILYSNVDEITILQIGKWYNKPKWFQHFHISSEK